MILAIETSCDDTCAAVLDGGALLSNVVSSQDEFHARYGGVVPEVASRQHLRLVNSVVAEALSGASVDLAGLQPLSVTTSPARTGAHLVGVATPRPLPYRSGAHTLAVNPR